MTIRRRITAATAAIACCGAVAACGSGNSAATASDPVVNSAAFIPFCEATLKQQKLTAKNLTSVCQCIQRVIARSGTGNLRASQAHAGGFPGPNGDTAVFLGGGCGATATSTAPPHTTT